jgi:hypothetical protein
MVRLHTNPLLDVVGSKEVASRKIHGVKKHFEEALRLKFLSGGTTVNVFTLNSRSTQIPRL